MKKYLLAVVLAFSSAAVAQGHDGLPTLRSFEIAPGSLLDLDAGVVLRERKVGALQADMQFGRDGIGFYLDPLVGGMVAMAGDTAPGRHEWSRDRIRVGRRGEQRVTAFLQTSHGVARVSLAIVNPYSVASASLQWVVVPPTDPVFLAAPTDLQASWEGEQGARSLRVSWSGGQTRYMVEVRSGEQLRKEFVSSSSISLADLDPQGVHRITVRGLEDGAISLPGVVMQHGPRKPVERNVLEYADNWYDSTGGISLTKGAVATDHAEVVCYLYGVYVPGGGAQKIGQGRATFERISQLPTDGYLPSYGRLDESDVYAIRLPDGRYGMVWLDANDGGDLRSGMRAHTVFLPDGRRDLMAAPVATSTTKDRVATVQWPKVTGAVSYRISVPGRPVVLTKQASASLAGLAADCVHDVAIVAVSQEGDESPAGTTKVHTYGFDVRIGRFTLPMQRGGFEFATEHLDARNAKGLQLTGGAGSGQGLSFKMDGLIVSMGGRKYGDLSDLKAPATGSSDWYSDHRKPESEEFLVFPKAGGCAMVRIVLRGFPSTLEYLWVPELPK